jgi:ABC-type glycerol-3-phosphate transport system permease component
MDRITGMQLGVMPGLISVHIVFGLVFFKFNYRLRLLLSLIIGMIISVIVGQVMTYELIKTEWDLYGYWDMTLTNWLIGVILWEASYHIVKVIENRNKIKNGANIG